MNKSILSGSQVADFNRDGYVLVPALFDTEESDILRKTAKADAAFQQNAYDLKDGEGGATKLTLWNKAGENLYGTVARCPRIVDSMEQLLEDEVYHYHSKMSIKEPFTGGAWSWHQDYGYWYMNGCLYSDMASAFIAVDPNTKENGCLQVLKGSHKMGRVEHGKFGDQTGADPERVEAAKKLMELVYVEMNPGDVLFFIPIPCIVPTKTNHQIHAGRSFAATTQSTTIPIRPAIIPPTKSSKKFPTRR